MSWTLAFLHLIQGHIVAKAAQDACHGTTKVVQHYIIKHMHNDQLFKSAIHSSRQGIAAFFRKTK